MTDFESDAATILHNLALERTGWRRYVFGRWYIAAEPLRNDAGRLLRQYKFHTIQPLGTRVCGDDGED